MSRPILRVRDDSEGSGLLYASAVQLNIENDPGYPDEMTLPEIIILRGRHPGSCV